MPELTEREALEAINRLRSNVVATQTAGWSDTIYPLVAILNAAGLEVDRNPTDGQIAEHFDTYGGAGGYPGKPKSEPSQQMLNRARNARHKRDDLAQKMRGD